MNINLNNYEAYFLDYYEGNLSPDLVKGLMQFISEHPELKEEFESFEPVTLQIAEEIKYDKKDALKKQLTGINPSNFDEYAVEYMEGSMALSLQKELKVFIAQNPLYQKELELYAKTKLTPDTSIVFDNKSFLKRRNRGSAAFYYWSAAASVAVLIGVYFLLNKNEPSQNKIVNHAGVNDTAVNVKTLAHVNDTAVDLKSIVKAKDTNRAAKRILLIRNPTKNDPAIAVIKHSQKQLNKKPVVIKKINQDSAVVVNKGTHGNQDMPLDKKPITVPTHPENDSIALNKNLQDTSSIWMPLIKENIQPKRKRSKFFITLATFVCKGLHKVTGQHIELEKKFSSDTTTIVAYQLDLGNKTFQFPVKE